MTANHVLGGLFACCVLAACASTKAPVASTAAADIDRLILEAAAKVEAAQTHLYHAGAFSSPSEHPPANLPAGQRVTLTWKGDALHLLGRMAIERGLGFQQHGVRMPLPVVIEATNETVESVLAKIRSQIGYRASVDHSGSMLVLSYNGPRS